MGEFSLRDQLLTRAREATPTYEPYQIDGLGTIYIKKLDVGERDRLDPKIVERGNTRVAVLMACCFDERGIRIFQDYEADLVRRLDPDMVDPIVTAALALNHLRQEDQETIAKNSNGQVDNSS